MHQPIRELSRISEEQQPGGIQIEAADRDPSSRRKARKNRRTAPRIVPRDHLADRLVIEEHLGF
jgi:hypothetical protein